MAERMAEAHDLDLQVVPRHGERVTKADVETYLTRQPGSAPPLNKIQAAPAARRLAHERQIDLKMITGTGPNGRIQSADVREAAARQPGSTFFSEPAPSLSAVAEAGSLAIRRITPLTNMRRAIAERLTTSVREIPQFTVNVTVEMSRALAIVEDWRVAQPDEPKVTLTALLVKACAWSLLRHHRINATFEPERIIEWAEINIGVAVAIEEGLIVPVIHGAERLGLGEISIRLADLGRRARQGQLRREEIQGGTFTISNLGMFGVDSFTAILNPPQAAILAVGRVVRQPVALENEQLEVRPIANFTLTADHRLIDGALAGRFLSDLRGVIERPGLLM
jgi:pyruvate dehydrogenase E2 component (dihydrolipoamide acetyltransferase)